jgi:hypothetical protein
MLALRVALRAPHLVQRVHAEALPRLSCEVALAVPADEAARARLVPLDIQLEPSVPRFVPLEPHLVLVGVLVVAVESALAADAVRARLLLFASFSLVLPLRVARSSACHNLEAVLLLLGMLLVAGAGPVAVA